MNRSMAFEIIKAVVFSLIISLFLMLLVSSLTIFTDIKLDNATLIASLSKHVSIIIGVMISVKEKQVGWLKGLIGGAIYSLLAFIVFSLISGEFIFDRMLGFDIVFSTIFGMFSGVLAVNVKK